jgi:hypothetical protein
MKNLLGILNEAQRQSLPGLESHVLGQLPATAGENGEYPEIRGWGTKVRYTNRGRQGGPDGGQVALRAKY